LNVTYSDSLMQAFVLDGDAVKKIYKLLDDRIGPAQIEFKCADKITRPFSEVGKALGYENPKDKQIEELEIGARSSDFEKSATIGFRANEWAGVSIRISASDQVVSHLRSDLLDLLSGTSPWYGVLARTRTVLLASLVFMTLCGVLLLVLIAYLIGQQVDLTPSHTFGVGIILSFAAGMVLGTVHWLWGKNFWKKVFPMGAFLIGQGKNRHEHLDKIHWCLLIPIILLVLGTAASVYFSFR
jgi:hypothetical protein